MCTAARDTRARGAERMDAAARVSLRARDAAERASASPERGNKFRSTVLWSLLPACEDAAAAAALVAALVDARCPSVWRASACLRSVCSHSLVNQHGAGGFVAVTAGGPACTRELV